MPTPSDKRQEMLVMLAKEIGKLPNRVSIEGHTDSKPFAGQTAVCELGAVGGPRQCGAAI